MKFFRAKVFSDEEYLFLESGYSKVITNEYLIGVYRITIEKDDYEWDEEVELRFVVYGWKPNEHFAFKVS